MENLRLYFVTYNVGTSSPDQDLHELLSLIDGNSGGGSKPATHLPDLYIVSLQEVSAKPTSMLMDALFDDPWTNALCSILARRDYVKLKTIRLQGLLLSVFCLRKHILDVREVESDYTRTGLSGMWGNKGAVSIRLNAYGCSVCFVNAHLTAHDEGLDDRVEDYNSIVKDQKFHVQEHTEIFFHDYVFWMGDLNFRLVEEFEKGPEEIDKFIKSGDLNYLFQHDQLNTVRNEGRAFSELIENRPDFAPTFKFDVGSCDYDYKRRPAWTDRILYKVNSNNYENVTLKAEQKSYRAHSNYTLSDHKPVSADFVIKVFADVSEHMVQFEKLSCWYLGDDNTIVYRMAKDAPKYNNDWIGVFKDNFASLDDYLMYEYTNKAGSPVPITKQPHNQQSASACVTAVQKQPNSYKYSLTFSEYLPVSNTVTFSVRLVYFSLTEDKVQSVLGISDPIHLVKKDSD